MSVTVLNPRTQIAEAVSFARDARHHSGCYCFQFRDVNKEAFCSDREALWNRCIDRLIDQCRT
jgi:hypothetical protein